jgi:hypothetical protein
LTQLDRVGGGQLVTNRICELDNGLRAQATVKVIVKRNLRKFLEV